MVEASNAANFGDLIEQSKDNMGPTDSDDQALRVVASIKEKALVNESIDCEDQFLVGHIVDSINSKLLDHLKLNSKATEYKEPTLSFEDIVEPNIDIKMQGNFDPNHFFSEFKDPVTGIWIEKFQVKGERQGLHGSLELVTNQSMKAHDGGVVAILLYRVIGGNPHLITINADNTLAIWDIKKSSNRLRVYCMVAHPLKPHLVAIGTNGGIIVSEFDSGSLILVTPLLMSGESRDDSAIRIPEDELRLLNLHLSNTTEPSHGKLYGDSFEPLCVTHTKKSINAPISLYAYSVLSVSSSRKYVAVVWPDIPCLSIDKVRNWSIFDLGSARLLASDTYCDRFAILESTIPPRMPIIHKESFSKMGMSLLSSYCRAQIIEVYGLRKKMMDIVFCGSFSKIDSRYSNCRAVRVLLLSPQHDFSVVEKSLKVTSSIGDHFHSALFEKNLNYMLMVLLGVWNVSFLGYLYFQIMEKFMSIIQHVNRESTYEGMPIHGVSFSYEIVPCDFIVAMKSQQLVYPNGKEISNYDGSKSNFFTQPNVPAYGKTTEQPQQAALAPFNSPSFSKQKRADALKTLATVIVVLPLGNRGSRSEVKYY
ncbi:hypothetical protein V6N13_130109 [Hibiscus sabdariffa]